MTVYEMDVSLSGLYMKNVESWNQTRQLVYTMAQINSKNRINIREIMPLPWDTDLDEGQVEIEDSERERLKLKMQEFIKQKKDGC